MAYQWPERRDVIPYIYNKEQNYASTLGTLIDVHESINHNQEDHVLTYRTWRQKRQRSILHLKQLIKQIEKHDEVCDTVKLAAETVGAISDIVSIIGAAFNTLNIGDKETSKSMIQGGRNISKLGNIVSVGTSFVRNILEEYDAEVAKEILQEDGMHAEKLNNFLKPSEKLFGLINGIMDFNLFSIIMKEFTNLKMDVNFMQRLWKRNGNKKIYLPRDIMAVVNLLPVSDMQRKIVKQFLVTIIQSADSWKLFEFFIENYKKYPFAFQICNRLYKSSGRNALEYRPRNALQYASNTMQCATLSSPKEVMTQGILSAYSLATNVVSLMDTAEKISKQEPSELVIKLKEASELMQQELINFDEMYFRFI